MTLFNARLGWWLGNPGLGGSETHSKSHPNFAIRPLIDEALGRTNDTNPYIYLSDGGHFENLGIYESVLRRCHVIVASDASCDRDFKFDELGNAIRKIRIDLGIPIEFDLGLPIASQGGTSYCAVARIRYSCVDANAPDGALIYIKPVVYESSEPRDVMNYYAATNKVFPHESTADQWFSESQFESYRALGAHVIETICDARETERLVDFAEWSYGHAYPKVERPGWLGDLRRVATIRFEPARCDIVPAEQRELERLAQLLEHDPNARLSLVGRRFAAVESDEALAMQRAKAVLTALTKLGVADNRCEIGDRDTDNMAHRVDVFVLKRSELAQIPAKTISTMSPRGS